MPRRMRGVTLLLLSLGFQVVNAANAGDPLPAPDALKIAPAEFTLQSARTRQAILVTGSFGPRDEADLSRAVTYESLKPQVAEVSKDGIVTARGDGTTEIVARLPLSMGGKEARATVTVRGFTEQQPVDFRTDVIAALSRAGCNQGSCHGSPQGKNGFRLSLRGYDPGLDYLTLTREDMGRRTNRSSPEDSLILLKATGRIAHQGGVRFRQQDPAYETLLTWVRESCRDSAKPAKVARLDVLPGQRRLHTTSPAQQIVVRAHFEDGAVRDVTNLTVFTTNNSLAADVSPTGLVEFKRTGEASILVRYLDQITSARLTYVRLDLGFKFKAPEPANYVDEFVFAKQRDLQLVPASLADDATFLRRVFLDVIGTLPTPDEARAFLDSTDPNRRAKLIDQLLEREEYAQFWAMKWADILRGSPTTISERGVHSFHRYLVRTMAEDRPMDAFARELLTSLGNTLDKPAANFHRISRTPEEAAETTAQLFLGVRMQCAKCHNHPFEGITQTNYYGLAAYFAQVQRKGSRFMLDDEVIYLAPGHEVQHPLTRKNQEPVAFGVAAGKLEVDDDRRARLADWLTRRDNHYLAPSLVNRVWYHLMGRGIVEPVDDFRDTNPPANPELLRALSEDFKKGGYRLKPIVRTILNSRAYQLASLGEPKQSPDADNSERYCTKSLIRMLSAEQILDAVSSATGVAEEFKGYPAGTRAIQLAEGGINHPFLQAFSKPVRDQTCECAREEDPALPQMLHLLNNVGLVNKIKSPKSRIAKMLGDNKATPIIIEEVYLATLSRRPTEAEIKIVMRHPEKLANDRAKAFADLQFALMNTSEFLLRH